MGLLPVDYFKDRTEFWDGWINLEALIATSSREGLFVD